MIKALTSLTILILLLMNTSCQSGEQEAQKVNYDIVPRYVNFDAALRKPEQVYFLNISTNPHSLDKFDNLEVLALSRCTIDSENAGNLLGTKKLKKFIAMDCNIEQLSFSEAQRNSIEFVKIAYSKIIDETALSNELTSLKRLNHLMIARSSYSSFPEELTILQGIKELSIGQDIDKFDYELSFENISKLVALEVLLINSSDISNLPPNFNKLNFIKSFGFYNCPSINVMEVLEETKTWPQLENLEISAMKLENLPQSIIEHKALKSICISDNLELHISETFETLSKISTLESLDISFSIKTEDFDSTILNNLPKLKNLKKLNMSGNTLFSGEYYWGILSQLENMEEIIMYSTSGRLQPDINKLKKLKKLEISETGSKMFDGVSSLPAQIEEIICAESFLEEFPEALLTVTALNTLSLFHNEIPQIPEEISQLKKLEHLNLAHNELKELPESIKELKNLKYLNLMGNPLDNYPEKRKQIEEWLPNTIIFWGI